VPPPLPRSAAARSLPRRPGQQGRGEGAGKEEKEIREGEEEERKRKEEERIHVVHAVPPRRRIRYSRLSAFVPKLWMCGPSCRELWTSAFVSTFLAGFGKPPRAGEVLPKILLIVLFFFFYRAGATREEEKGGGEDPRRPRRVVRAPCRRIR
jgi:hypothetical protein